MATTKKKSALKNVLLKSGATKNMKALAGSTKKRTLKLAVSLLDFQKTTFDNAVKMLAAVQSQTEKLIKQLTVQSSWMPPEGKKVVDEWINTVNRSRDDFKHTMDKSFDLLTDYFKRLDSHPAASKSRASAKRTAKKQ